MVLKLGSPPHTRGPLKLIFCIRRSIGITPAYAGTTRAWRTAWLRPRDHPRIRGDHWAVTCTSKEVTGSPPHTRGPHSDIDSIESVSGITPAYAGTTPGANLIERCRGDHPRIRGDHFFCSDNGGILPGSPPHTRGPHHRERKDVVLQRITPAYAGTTTDAAA